MERLQKLKQLSVGTLCLSKYVIERLNQEVNICGVIVVTNWQASQSQGMYNIKVYIYIKKSEKKNLIKIISTMPSFRYRIELKVEDDIGLTTFILFDSMAEKLLHISAKELINKCSQVRI